MARNQKSFPPVACVACGKLVNQSVKSASEKRLPVCSKCKCYESFYRSLRNGNKNEVGIENEQG